MDIIPSPPTTVLVVGDSLAMVRPNDGIFIQDIYPSLLQRSLGSTFLVVNGAKRANTTRDILTDDYFHAEIVRPCMPTIVIIHLGIVDCTPRLFTQREKSILAIMERTPLIRHLGRWLISRRSSKRYAHTQTRKIQLVPLDEYESNLSRFVDRTRQETGCQRFLFINIVQPGPRLTDRNHGIAVLIARYNNAISRIAATAKAAVIDLNGFTAGNPSLLLPDGYHITGTCHALLASDIQRMIMSTGGSLCQTA